MHRNCWKPWNLHPKLLNFRVLVGVRVTRMLRSSCRCIKLGLNARCLNEDDNLTRRGDFMAVVKTKSVP